MLKQTQVHILVNGMIRTRVTPSEAKHWLWTVYVSARLTWPHYTSILCSVHWYNY